MRKTSLLEHHIMKHTGQLKQQDVNQTTVWRRKETTEWWVASVL